MHDDADADVDAGPAAAIGPLDRLDVDGAVAHLSAAIRELTACGRRRDAAMACARLGEVYASLLGNLTAGRAWFGRAARLVADEEPCIEQGWVAVAAMGCDVDDPDHLLACAELALDRARRFGDVNLEMKALADGGLAHVQAGRIPEGMAMLDEAMALACSTADDADTMAKSVCSLYTACYYAVDFERAASWTTPLRRRGVVAPVPPGPLLVSSHCDSVQAALLVELGRWSEAEALLARAIEEFEAMMPVPSWHPAIALADLRVLQGRLTDAEALLLGKDAHIAALLPMARLHRARGDHALARAAARRGLRVMGDDTLRAAELLSVLADAELADGDVDAALAAVDDLERRASVLGPSILRGRAAAVRARVRAAAGDIAGAIATIDDAAGALAGAGAPWLEATLLLELARLRELSGDRAGAVIDAKAAAATLASLDVVLQPDEAAVLARLVGDAARTTAPVATLERAERGWIASAGGVRVRLAESKGMQHLAELLRAPGTERHALDLVDRIEGTGAVARRTLGDAGPVIDGAARTAYRHRIEALRSEIDDALASGRDDRAQILHGELDALVQQLASAFGLGGRGRRASSAAEKARLNVTRALRSAIGRVVEELPDAGAALDRGVRTGLYCVYSPAEGDVRWIVQPGLNGSAGP